LHIILKYSLKFPAVSFNDTTVSIEKRMLEDYNKKRNFKATPEPTGIDSSTSKGSSQNNKSVLS